MAEESDRLITAGTPIFRRTTLALFAAGFSTFAVLYGVQPLMPVFADEFHVSPAESSLSLSLPCAMLALALLVVSPLSEVWGRKPIMVASLFASAILTLIAVIVPSWHGFLALRALTGLAASGLPAVAMAYLSEEMDARAIGLSMGLLIGGNAMGGMVGRLIAGIVTDHLSWRVGLGTIGVLALIAAILFWRGLPPSRRFLANRMRWRQVPGTFGQHFRDPGLPWLFAEAFLLMGGFVSVYNYIGFRLLDPPYNLSQSAIGAIFRGLSRRHVQFGGDRRDRQPARTPPGLVARHPARDRRYSADPVGAPSRHHRRHRRRDGEFLRRPFGGEFLDRATRPARPGAGLLGLPVPVLSGLVGARDGGRLVLRSCGVDGGRRLLRRALRARAGHRAPSFAPAAPRPGHILRPRPLTRPPRRPI